MSSLQDHGVLVFNGLGENYVNALQTLRYFVQKLFLFSNMVNMLCFCSKEGGAKLPSGRTVSGDGGWISKV